MDNIIFDKTGHTVEATRVSGSIFIYLDNNPSVQLTFTEKVKICFDVEEKLSGIPTCPSSPNLKMEVFSNHENDVSLSSRECKSLEDSASVRNVHVTESWAGVLSTESQLQEHCNPLEASMTSENHEGSPIGHDLFANSEVVTDMFESEDNGSRDVSIPLLNCDEFAEEDGCIDALKEKSSNLVDNEEEEKTLDKPCADVEGKSTGNDCQVHPYMGFAIDFKIMPDVRFCFLCGKTFNDPEERVKHTHGFLDPVKCPKCNLVFFTRAEVILHDYECHTSSQDHRISNKALDNSSELPKQMSCPVCSELISRNKVLDHICQVHTKEEHLQCCICHQFFFTLYQLYKHRKAHYVILKKRHLMGWFYCSLCPRAFQTKADFNKHIYTHQTVCVFCEKDFGATSILKFHYKTEHDSQMLTCDVCGVKKATEAQMYEHRRYHRFVKEKPCPICGAVVKALTHHMKRWHPDYDMPKLKRGVKAKQREKPSVLSTNSSVNGTDSSNTVINVGKTCSSAVPSKSLNTVKDAFLCAKCPKTFKTKGRLSAHMVVHEDCVTCPQCQKNLSNKRILDRHIRIVHLKSHVYFCDICGKQCTTKGNLKMHMRIHSQVKVFSCTLCPQGFNYKASLKSHMRSRHHLEWLD